MSNLQVSDLLKLDAQDLRKWVQVKLKKKSKLMDEFNWLGLAESLGTTVNSQNTNSREKIQSAETAIIIYEWLEKNGKWASSYSCHISAIALRVYMLSNKTISSLPASLNENELSKQFWKNIEYSLHEVSKTSKSLRNKLKKKDINLSPSELDNLKKLRMIKNKLKLAKILPSNIILFKELKSKGWFDKIEKLP